MDDGPGLQTSQPNTGPPASPPRLKRLALSTDSVLALPDSISVATEALLHIAEVLEFNASAEQAEATLGRPLATTPAFTAALRALNGRVSSFFNLNASALSPVFPAKSTRASRSSAPAVPSPSQDPVPPTDPPVAPRRANGPSPAPPRAGSQRSFAAVTKGGVPAADALPIDHLLGLQRGFPSLSLPQLMSMAQRLGGPAAPAQKPAAPRKRAPRGAHRVITVSFFSQNAPPVAGIPRDGALLQNLRKALHDDATDEPHAELVKVTWNRKLAFRVEFDDVPSEQTETLVHGFFTAMAPNPDANNACITTRFSFKNTIVFPRVPSMELDGSRTTEDSLHSQLLDDQAWMDITITDTNIFIPKDSLYGYLFVQFEDDASGHAFKRLLNTSCYLNGDLVYARRPRKQRDTAPFCTTCHDWAHTTRHCRSLGPRCAFCSEFHDERVHHMFCTKCKETNSTVCTHPVCSNCGQGHRADSSECAYYVNRNDLGWHKQHRVSHEPKRRR